MMQLSLAIDPTRDNVHSKTCAYKNQSTDIIQRALSYLESSIKYQAGKLSNPFEVKDYLQLQLAPEPNEVFAAVFLSNDQHVIAFEKLFYGTVNSATVHPRVVIQRALYHNAAAVIIAHNHPSGSLEPSSADEYITQNLKSILQHIDVRLLDHVIVSHKGKLSFAERGLL